MKKSKLARNLCVTGLVLLLLWMGVGLFMPTGSRPIIDKARRDQLEILDLGSALERYKGTYEEYPTGDNATILKKLLGDNPQKIQFLSLATNSVSGVGEYLDPWGRPYSITVFSTNGVAIISAGKDKVFGNKDDVVFNSQSNGLVKP